VVGRKSACALIVLLAAGVWVCAERPASGQVSRGDAVRALLARSRMLEDVYFRVPVSLWRRYRESLAAGDARVSAPVAVVGQQAVYTLTAGAGRRPVLSAALTFRVFDPKGCRNLPVFDAARAWRKVTVNGKAAKLATTGGMIRFSPEAPGVYKLTARTSPAKVGPDGGRVALRIPRTVQTHVRFDSPRAWRVSCVGGVATGKGAAADGTHASIALGPRTDLSILFRPPPVRFDRKPQYRLRGDVAWNLDAGRQEVAAKIDVAIVGGRTDRLDLILPAGTRRLNVTGPDVREVRGVAGPVAVHLRGPTRDKTSLTIRYELAAGRGVRRLARPELAGGRWAGGTLVITNTAGAGEIVVESARGLGEMSVADIGASASAILAGEAVLAYRITGPRWTAAVDVVDLGEFALREAVADLGHYRLTFRDDGTIVAKVRYEIRNRARQFLRVRLPAGSVVIQARVNDKWRPVSPVDGLPGTYRLALVRSKASVRGLVSFPVELVYLCRTGGLGAKGMARLPLPQIDLPIAYAWCEAYVPRDMKVEKWSGPMRRVARYSSETATASMDYGWGELAEGYRLADRPVQAPKPTLAVTPVPVVDMWNGATVTRDVGNKAKRSLAMNYYRAGKNAYGRNRYASANASLVKVIELAPKSPEADNAKRLLANIKLAQGKLKLRSRSEQAAGAQTKREIYVGNRAMLVEQRMMLEKGAKASREGLEGEAEVQFKAAAALSKQLVEQGADTRYQGVIMRRARRKLAEDKAQKMLRVRQLDQDVKSLRKQKKYGEALKVAKVLQRTVVSGGDMKQIQSVQKELDKLVLADSTLLLGGQRAVTRPSTPKKPTRRGRRSVTVTRVYDINDLVVNASNVDTSEQVVAGGVGGGGGVSAGSRADRRRQGESVAKTVGSLLARDRDKRQPFGAGRAGAKVRFQADSSSNTLVVTGGEADQERVVGALGRLRGVRGPQIQHGDNFARQRAKGVVILTDGANGDKGLAIGGVSYRKDRRPDLGNVGLWAGKVPEIDKSWQAGGNGKLKKFIADNYEWAGAGSRDGGIVTTGGGKSFGWGLATTRPTTQPARVVSRDLTQVSSVGFRNLTAKLASNLGQKVNVRSVNINVDARAAKALGARFQVGANGVIYAVVDDAQFRTLRQIENRRAASGRRVAPNRRGQDTIVGTDALLANDMLANVTFAADRTNSLAVNGNVIDLPHRKFILINNGRYLTAVNAGAMQHWTEQSAPATPMGDAPEDIDIPRVGRLVKFEKTLVNPTDTLVLRAEYLWQGD